MAILGIVVASFSIAIMRTLRRQLTGAQVHWTRYKEPEGRFQVDFPAREIKDISGEVARNLTEMGVSVKGSTHAVDSKFGFFAVMVLDDIEKHRRGRTDLEIKEDMLNSACNHALVKIDKWETRNRPAGVARRVCGHRSEKGTTVFLIQEAYVLDGRAYIVEAVVRTTYEEDPVVERFFESFRVQE